MADDGSALADFETYAASRGLTLERGDRLPRTTPLLAEGELRTVEAVMSGWLAKFVEARLATIVREEVTTNAAGVQTRGEAHFTVALTHVPRRSSSFPCCSASGSRTTTCWARLPGG